MLTPSLLPDVAMLVTPLRWVIKTVPSHPPHQLLEDKAGAPVLEGGFWMNSIKTHCYATFDGKEAAERAMAALQGLQWPPQSFKRLEAKIGDMSAEEVSIFILVCV